MSIDQDRLSIAEDLIDRGAPVTQALSYLGDEPWTPYPACVSRVVAELCHVHTYGPEPDNWNQLLRPVAAELVGTDTGADDEETRAWKFLDWLVRRYDPAWLRLAGLDDHADALARLPEITEDTDPNRVASTLAAAAQAAIAAASAAPWAKDSLPADDALVVARTAAQEVALAAANWDAAWNDRWDDTENNLLAAGLLVARVAAFAATWPPVWDSICDLCLVDTGRLGAASGNSLSDSDMDTVAEAAVTAAVASLRPVHLALQESLVDLIRAMCALGRQPVN